MGCDIHLYAERRDGGKWKRLNGMWMKAVDGCRNWKFAPMKARILLVPPERERVTVGPMFEDEVPF